VSIVYLWFDPYPKSQDARLHASPDCIVVVTLLYSKCCSRQMIEIIKTKQARLVPNYSRATDPLLSQNLISLVLSKIDGDLGIKV
jgi:hypothetical protein